MFLVPVCHLQSAVPSWWPLRFSLTSGVTDVKFTSSLVFTVRKLVAEQLHIWIPNMFHKTLGLCYCCYAAFKPTCFHTGDVVMGKNTILQTACVSFLKCFYICPSPRLFNAHVQNLVPGEAPILQTQIRKSWHDKLKWKIICKLPLICILSKIIQKFSTNNILLYALPKQFLLLLTILATD